MEWFTDRDTLLLQDSIERVNEETLAFLIDLEPDVTVFLYRHGNLADEVTLAISLLLLSQNGWCLPDPGLREPGAH